MRMNTLQLDSNRAPAAQDRRLRLASVAFLVAAALAGGDIWSTFRPLPPRGTHEIRIDSWPRGARVSLQGRTDANLAGDQITMGGLKIVTGLTPYTATRNRQARAADIELPGYEKATLALNSRADYVCALTPSWPEYLVYGPIHFLAHHPLADLGGLFALWGLAGLARVWRDERRLRRQQLQRLGGIGPGMELGGYAVDKELGAGGMGQVFLARGLESGEPVALKLLHGSYAADTAARDRFVKEINVLRQLQHPNIVSLLNWGEVEGRLYLVMDFLQGSDLQAKLARATPYAEVRELTRQILAGLLHAHKRGVVHRDLKPSNLFQLNTGRVKIVDFGIAQFGQTLAGPGEIRGTPGYMSPEQIQGLALDWRSDYYSLAVILHESLTGKPLFRESGPVVEVFRRQLVADVETLEAPDLDPRFASTVLQWLRRNPQERMTDLGEAEAFLTYLGERTKLTPGKESATEKLGGTP